MLGGVERVRAGVSECEGVSCRFGVFRGVAGAALGVSGWG